MKKSELRQLIREEIGKLNEEATKFKIGDNVTVNYPTLLKPIVGKISFIINGGIHGDFYGIKTNNTDRGIWDEKYITIVK